MESCSRYLDGHLAAVALGRIARRRRSTRSTRRRPARIALRRRRRRARRSSWRRRPASRRTRRWRRPAAAGRRSEPGRRPARRRRRPKARRRRAARRRRRAKAWRATRRRRPTRVATLLWRVAALLAGPGLGLLRARHRALHLRKQAADARSRADAGRGDRGAEATTTVAAPRHEHRLLLVVNARHVVASRRAPRRSTRRLAPGHDLSWPARRRAWRPSRRSARSSSRRRPSRRWRAPRRRGGARRRAIGVLAEALVLVLVVSVPPKDTTHQARSARLLLLRGAARPWRQV